MRMVDPSHLVRVTARCAANPASAAPIRTSSPVGDRREHACLMADACRCWIPAANAFRLPIARSNPNAIHARRMTSFASRSNAGWADATCRFLNANHHRGMTRARGLMRVRIPPARCAIQRFRNALSHLELGFAFSPFAHPSPATANDPAAVLTCPKVPQKVPAKGASHFSLPKGASHFSL